MRKPLFLAVMILIMLACAVPGAPAVAPLPTFDSNSLQTFIVQTAEAAQTQTALVMPTFTKTPTTTFTPSITPSSTPTFIFKLSTPTPIPTYTIPPTIGTLKSPAAPSGSSDEENSTGDKPKKDEDPKKMSGRDWTCVWYGLTPPRNTVFKPKTHFTVQWMLFNSGNQSWPRTGVDFVYTGGFRHEETKIQDFVQSVSPGKEIWVRASFIAPKAAGDYATYFTLMVGKRKFCPVAYFFTVEE